MAHRCLAGLHSIRGLDVHPTKPGMPNPPLRPVDNRRNPNRPMSTSKPRGNRQIRSASDLSSREGSKVLRRQQRLGVTSQWRAIPPPTQVLRGESDHSPLVLSSSRPQHRPRRTFSRPRIRLPGRTPIDQPSLSLSEQVADMPELATGKEHSSPARGLAVRRALGSPLEHTRVLPLQAPRPLNEEDIAAPVLSTRLAKIELSPIQ